MEEQHSRRALMREAIDQFKIEFNSQFGVIPHVIFDDRVEKITKLSIKQLVNIGNKLIDLQKYPVGLRTKTRKREVVIVRQCIVSIANEMGYPYMTIGAHVNQHHSTCIYAKRLVERLLDIQDPETILIISQIKDAIKNKLGDDGDVQSNHKEGDNT